MTIYNRNLNLNLQSSIWGRGEKGKGKREKGEGCQHLGFLHDDWSFMCCRISEAEKLTLTTVTFLQIVQSETKEGCVDQFHVQRFLNTRTAGMMIARSYAVDEMKVM